MPPTTRTPAALPAEPADLINDRVGSWDGAQHRCRDPLGVMLPGGGSDLGECFALGHRDVP